jgi:hypothetical protein
VLERWSAVLGSDLLRLDQAQLGRAGRIAATVEAMERGVLAIAGGQLPDDAAGHRAGRPDLLLRHGTTDDGTHAYVPVDVKAHGVVGDAKRSSLRWSSVDDIAAHGSFSDARTTTGQRARIKDRLADALQLAHYWRMLQACGRAPAIDPVGGIIGTDVVDGNESPIPGDRTGVGVQRILRLRRLRRSSTSARGRRRERADHRLGCAPR